MADESFPVSFSLDLGNLPQNVTDIKTAVVAQDPKAQPLAQNAQEIHHAVVAQDPRAPPLAQNAQEIHDAVVAQDPKAPPLAQNVQDIHDAIRTFATKEDIRQLRWLVLKLWWLDHMCRHVTHDGAAQSVPAAALSELDVRDAGRLADVTAKQIEELAETLDEQYRLPLDEYEKMLAAFRPVAANLARQRTSSPQSTTTSRPRRT
jgi:hypothetical protein